MARNSISDRRELRRVLLASALFAFAFGLLCVVATTWVSGGAKVVWISCLVLGVAASGISYWVVSWRVHVAQGKLLPDQSDDLDFAEIRRLVPHIEAELHFSQVASFVEAIINPQSKFERIAETVQPNVRRLHVVSAYTFQDPPSAAGRSILVPLMLQTRGALIDGLEVRDGNDCRISTVGKNATLAFEVAAVRSLIRLLGSDAMSDYLVRIEEQVVKFLCSRSPHPETEADALAELIVALPAAAGTEGIKNEINRFIRRLRRYYPIAVICEGATINTGNVLLRHRQRITVDRLIASSYIPETPRTGMKFVARTRDRLRRVLGVRPAMIGFPLANADRCSSYHVQIIGREDTYLARQRISDWFGNTVEPTGESYNLQKRFGQRSAHLYVRKGEGYQPRYFVCNFFERMPGSLGSATMSALAAMVLIVVAALIKINGSDGQSPDLVAVILSFPAIAGTWLGFEQTRHLYGGVLMARVSLIVTVALAMVSAAYYAAGPGAYAGSVKVGVLGRSVASPWIWLAGAAMINFLASAGGWLLRANVESHFVKRPLMNDIGS